MPDPQWEDIAGKVLASAGLLALTREVVRRWWDRQDRSGSELSRIRDEYRLDYLALRREFDELRDKMTALEVENAKLRAELEYQRQFCRPGARP